MNYESEFKDIMIDRLKTKFNINHTDVLLAYLKLRYEAVFKSNPPFGTADFMLFLIKELYISYDKSGFDYADTKFSFSFFDENSLIVIGEELDYELNDSDISIDLDGHKMPIDQFITMVYQKMLDFSARQMKKYKKSKHKANLQICFKIQELNRIFGVSINDFPPIPHVTQDYLMRDQVNYEDRMEIYLFDEHFASKNAAFLSELDLRDYIFEHLYLIEEGLRPIEKEVDAGEGRIDILAKDKHGHFVVIELKTDVDKRLVWQCMYYPDVIQKRKGGRVRTIAVCPDYPPYMLDVLKKLDHVELYKFEATCTNKSIEDLVIEKINAAGDLKCHY